MVAGILPDVFSSPGKTWIGLAAALVLMSHTEMSSVDGS